MENKHLGDGTFIVRKSQMFIGDYSLSFLRRGKVRWAGKLQVVPMYGIHVLNTLIFLQVWHVHIRSRQQENGTVRYFLIDQVSAVETLSTTRFPKSATFFGHGPGLFRLAVQPHQSLPEPSSGVFQVLHRPRPCRASSQPA